MKLKDRRKRAPQCPALFPNHWREDICHKWWPENCRCHRKEGHKGAHAAPCFGKWRDDETARD